MKEALNDSIITNAKSISGTDADYRGAENTGIAFLRMFMLAKLTEQFFSFLFHL